MKSVTLGEFLLVSLEMQVGSEGFRDTLASIKTFGQTVLNKRVTWLLPCRDFDAPL